MLEAIWPQRAAGSKAVVKASTELWIPLLSSFLSFWSSLETCGRFNIDPLSFLRIQRLRCHPVSVQGLLTLVYDCSSLELAHTSLTITSREFCLESICICFEGTFGIWRCLEVTLVCTIWTFSIWCHLKGSDKDRFSSWVYNFADSTRARVWV